MMISRNYLSAIAQKYLTLLLSMGCVAALPWVAKTPAKALIFLAGIGSSGVGLIAHSQLERERGLISDSKLIERELRLSLPFKGKGIEIEQEAPITQPPPNWFNDLIRNSFHYRINGETGSGKSTLAENLISLASQSLGSGTEIILIDPKYPLSEWSITPQYKGIDQALAGLQHIADIVESRLDIARQAKDMGGQLPTFTPLLFVVDEIDWITSDHGSKATTLLKVGLKVGRALNIKVLYLGQTPLCTDLGLRKNDFRHSANFFLGENIPPAIEQEACHTRQDRKFWAEQYTARIARGDTYLALIKPMGRQCFIAPLPSPNPKAQNPQPAPQPTTAPSQPQETQDAVEWLNRCHSLPCVNSPQPQPQADPPVICPHCESVEWGANGSYGGRKRAKCKDCGKSFYLP